jgi:hypothetical protein
MPLSERDAERARGGAGEVISQRTVNEIKSMQAEDNDTAFFGAHAAF